jgi:hypothetical protein
VLVPISFTVSTLAQEVSNSDEERNAVIREALPKPFGPLTEQDLLSLANLAVFYLADNPLTGIALPPGLASIWRWDWKLEEKHVVINVKEKGLSEIKPRSQTS